MKIIKYLTKEKAIILMTPIIIGVFLYIIAIPLTIITILLVLCYSILILFPILESRGVKDVTKEAWKFSIKWWYDFRTESLNTARGQGLLKDIIMPDGTEKKFIAFKITRKKSEGQHSNQPLILVTEYNDGHFFMRDWDDTISSNDEEKWENPFLDVIPIVMKERKYYKDRKIKKEREDEEEDENE